MLSYQAPAVASSIRSNANCATCTAWPAYHDGTGQLRQRTYFDYVHVYQ
jgi:hypothetical protein